MINRNVFAYKFILWACAVPLILMSLNTHAYEKEMTRLSATMAEKISQANKTKVAVVDFTDLSGNVTQLGRFIAELFSVKLTEVGKGFQVVDRTHLNILIKEHKLSKTGLIDQRTAQELGKITGVDALITGTLTSFGDSVHIVVKVLDAETAQLITTGTGSIAKTKAIEEMIQTTVDDKGVHRPQPPVNIRKTFETKEVSFGIQSCQASAQAVNCIVFITNNTGQDRDVSLYNNTRMFDNDGNEYRVDKITFGNKESSGTVEKHMIMGIPIRAVFNFGGVSSKVSYISAIELNGHIDGKGHFKFKFRNIPLSRQ